MTRKIRQKGIASIVIVLTIIVASALAISAYIVLKPGKDTSINSIVVEPENTESSSPNGTPENTVNAALNQIEAELDSDNNALSREDESTDFEDDLINELEAEANETNL